MPRNVFHQVPFDEGTLLKLEILTQYLDEWLPVFIQQSGFSRVQLFDFQCGPGRDTNGVEGSPLRIANALAKAKPPADGHSIDFYVHFNDVSQEKVTRLAQELSGDSFRKPVELSFTTLSFEDCFERVQPLLQRKGVANFLFIDPTGLVRIELMIEKLSKLNCTDFLLFIPAADLYRFNSVSEFQRYFPEIKFEGTLVDASREICTYIRGKLKEAEQVYHLAHFAIQKRRAQRINSLVFGSRNLFGIYKFLTVAWKKSPNGEANYDLCGDFLCSRQLALPGIQDKPRKVEAFCQKVKNLILCKILLTNKDVAVYALVNGFLPTLHCSDVIRSLKKDGIIMNSPPLGYESIFKKNRVESFVFANLR